MDFESLPVQLRPVMRALAAAMRAREPAVRERVDQLRRQHPSATPDELARELIRTTRRRVAATGAASGAVAIAPGLGTLVALGTVSSQAVFALEQETELALGIAMLYGHELSGSDERLLEALIVIGIAGGAVQLRENVLVAGGERIAVSAFRRFPQRIVNAAGGHLLARVFARLLGTRAAAAVTRVAPLAVGVAIGAGFDWVTVTGLGRVAMRYYGPGGPAARRLKPLPETSAKDRGDVEGDD